ncbi:hypothetical protein ACRAWD_04250 [Caulobacter segnis]
MVVGLLGISESRRGLSAAGSRTIRPSGWPSMRWAMRASPVLLTQEAPQAERLSLRRWGPAPGSTPTGPAIARRPTTPVRDRRRQGPGTWPM